jgi:hypothetical protein
MPSAALEFAGSGAMTLVIRIGAAGAAGARGRRGRASEDRASPYVK